MKLSVEKLIWPHNQTAHKGYNRPAVAKGQTVFAIKLASPPKFFYVAYLSSNYAEKVAARASANFGKPAGISADIAANYRDFPTFVSGRETD